MEFEDIKEAWDKQPDSLSLDKETQCSIIKARYQSMNRSELRLATVSGSIALLAFLWIGFLGYMVSTKGISKMKEIDLIPPSFFLLAPLYIGILGLYPIINYIQQRMIAKDFQRGLRGYVMVLLIQLRNRVFMLRAAPIAYFGIYAIFIVGVLVSPDILIYKQKHWPILSIAFGIDLCFLIILFVCLYLLSKRYSHRVQDLRAILKDLDAEVS